MSGQKKVVASFALDAAQAKQELKALEAAEEQFSASGKSLATSLSNGYGDVEEKVGKLFKKLNDGGTVTQGEVDKIVAKLAALREAAEASGVPFEQMPEEFKRAYGAGVAQLNALQGAMGAAAQRTAAYREEVEAAAEAARKLADEQEQARELVEKVAEQYGETAIKIEEIRKASDATFPEQRKSLEAIQKELQDSEAAFKRMGRVGEDALKALRVESARVDAALDEVSKAAASGTGKIRDGVLGADRSFAQFTKTLSENPKEALEQLPKVAGSVISLRHAIEQAKATGGPVDDAAIARLRSFEQQLEKAKLEAGAMKREIDKATAGTTDASQSWQGFDSVINGVAGKFGKVGVGVVGAVAALKEGWAIGTQIAQAIGTDFTAMSDAIEKWSEKAKKVNSSFLSWLTGDGSFEQVRAATVLTKTAFEGYTSAVLAGITEIDNIKAHTVEFNKIAAAHKTILAEGAEGQRLANQAKKDGGGVLADYVRVLALADQAAKVHHKLMQEGIEGQRLWNDIKAQGKGTLVDLAKAIRDNQDEIAKLTTRTREQIAAEDDYTKSLNNVTTAILKKIAAEKEQLDVVINQEKVEDGLTETMRTRLAEIAASMVVKEGKEIPLTLVQIKQFEELVRSTVGLTDAERKRHTALVERLRTVEQMTQYERDNLAQELKRQLLINTTSQADAAHRAVLDMKTKTISNAAAATSKLTEEQMKVTKSSGEAASASEKLRGGFGRLAEDITKVVTGLGSAGKGLSDIASGINPTVEQMERLVGTMRDANAEAEKLATNLERASRAGQD